MYSKHKQNGKVLVIGGGIAGLASAALLARQNWDVLILEKNKHLGGRARVLESGGFMFDMGPSWYLMPEIFDNFFKIFGKKTEDYYKLVAVDPKYKIFFDGSDCVSLRKEISANFAWFDLQEKGGSVKLVNYLDKTKQAYEASLGIIYEDLWDPLLYFDVKKLKSFFEILFTFRIWESWDDYVSRFFKSEKIKKILGFPSVFLGGSPFNTPSLYAILSWADFGRGVWYPKGGMKKIVEALSSLAIKNGVVIKAGTMVNKIIVKNGRALGVETNKGFFPADVVVSTADLAFTETRLLGRNYRTYDKEYWLNKTLGISALLIYLGVKGSVRNLEHHNIYFARDWKKNFDDIFKRKIIPDDPSFYISVRTKTDKSIAPGNCEEIFILVPLASKEKYSHDEMERLYERVIRKVESLTGEKIETRVVFRKLFLPEDFAKDYLAYQGTALGLAHTFSQSLWFRPANKSRKVSNLYYAGQYTNPGVGVPMCLVSAEIVAKKIGYYTTFIEDIFKRGSTTYYYSSLFFRGQVKRDVFCLYAYVRTVDNLVDTKRPQKRMLDEIWEETVKAWKGEKVKSRLVRAFVELGKRKEFSWQWIEAFWQSMLSDLRVKDYSNTDLNKYMFGSAEVVGLMMARILDLPPEAEYFARLQGKAMQLVNFIRDVKEDMDLRRNYLGYEKSWLNETEKWNEFIRSKLDEFFDLQKEAERGYKFIPKRYLVPIKTASDMYKWTARKIYENPQVVLTGKIRPNKFRVFLRAIINYFVT